MSNLFEKGKYIKRLNRFTTLVKVKGKIEKAYLANSGRLKEILIEGADCILKKSKGKLPYKLIALKKDNIWISVDSHIVNKFFLELYENKKFPYLKDAEFERKEVMINKGRIDFVFKKNKKRIFVEVKSCTLVKKRVALFPDAPTLRGKRHVDFLIENKRKGNDSIIVFIVQREDADSFAPNSFTHFDFAKSLYLAMKEGVKVFLVVCRFDTYKLKLEKKSIKELELIETLLNEYILYRFPLSDFKLKRIDKNSFEINFYDYTIDFTYFEKNFNDFISFSKNRGVKLNLKEVERKGNSLILNFKKIN